MYMQAPIIIVDNSLYDKSAHIADMTPSMQYHKQCLVYVVTYVHIVTSEIHDIGHEMSCSTFCERHQASHP